MVWQELVEFLGGATAISVTIGYLGKNAIEAYLNGRIEEHRASLERITNEQSVRFSHLHSERAQVIKDFYERLAKLDDLLDSTLRPFQHVAEPSLEDKISQLANQFNELREYFIPKRIFLDASLCELIDRILEVTKSAYNGITVYPIDPRDPNYAHNRELLKERHEFWEKARAMHKSEIQELKLRLEAEFRRVLGIGAQPANEADAG